MMHATEWLIYGASALLALPMSAFHVWSMNRRSTPEQEALPIGATTLGGVLLGVAIGALAHAAIRLTTGDLVVGRALAACFFLAQLFAGLAIDFRKVWRRRKQRIAPHA
jgi:hypothetical protein